MGLIGLMVQLSLMAAVMSMMVDRSLMEARLMRSAEIDREVQHLSEKIHGVVTDLASCTQSLSGQAFNGPISVKDPHRDNFVMATEGTRGKDWSLSRVRLENVVDVAGMNGFKRGTLQVVATKDSGKFLGSQSRGRSVAEVYFEASAHDPNVIQSCYGANSFVQNIPRSPDEATPAVEEESAKLTFCKLIPEEWKHNTRLGLRCQLREKILTKLQEFEGNEDLSQTNLCQLLGVRTIETRFGSHCKLSDLIRRKRTDRQPASADEQAPEISQAEIDLIVQTAGGEDETD